MKQADPNRKIVSYVRCSTDKQTIEVQATEIKKYCEYKNIEVDKSYVDYAISGKTFDREQFNEMIALVEKGEINEIIITELSRWGRNMLEALEKINILKKHNCNLIVLKENVCEKCRWGGGRFGLLQDLPTKRSIRFVLSEIIPLEKWVLNWQSKPPIWVLRLF